MPNIPDKLKDALISVLVGAVIAFLTSLIDGLRDVLMGYGDNAVGAVAGSYMFAYKHIIRDAIQHIV